MSRAELSAMDYMRNQKRKQLGALFINSIFKNPNYVAFEIE
jgi:hypothetical protein